MTAVRAGDVPATLRRLDPKIRVLLFYGTDNGLVAELARSAAEAAVPDPSDPFGLVRLDGDTVAAEPGRLADEAGTLGLFGGRRAVWVRATARNIAPAVEAVLAQPGDSLVVIESGNLSKSAPLRIACERSPLALALPCYADEGRTLAAMADEAVRAAGFSIGREARAALLASLGADRLASRGEIEKLLLFAHGRREITLDDVDAAVSDVSALALDGVVDAAFEGDGAGAAEGVRRLLADGVAPAAILAGALRHALALLERRVAVEEGRSIGSAVELWRGLHFRRKDSAGRQLSRWQAGSLGRVLDRLQAATLDSRRHAELGPALASQVLLGISREAGKAAPASARG